MLFKNTKFSLLILVIFSVVFLSGCFQTISFSDVLQNDQALLKKLEGHYVSLDTQDKPEFDRPTFFIHADGTLEIKGPNEGKEKESSSLASIKVEKIGSSLFLQATKASMSEAESYVTPTTYSIFKYEFTKEGDLAFYVANNEYIRSSKAPEIISRMACVDEEYNSIVCFLGTREKTRELLVQYEKEAKFWKPVGKLQRITTDNKSQEKK